MSLYIFLSLILFLVIDYIYIYNFFDSKLLYVSSGSKLKKVSNKKQKISFDLEINKILFLIFCSIILWLLNFSIVFNELNSNSLEVKIFSKTLSVASILQDKYTIFKAIYYISSYIFFGICCFKFRKKLILLFNYLFNTNKYSLQDTPSQNDKLIALGADEKRGSGGNFFKFSFSKYINYWKYW